jgi:hypothetical protein
MATSFSSLTLTWGQIRLNLLQTSPGIPLDLLDEWMNARYGSVLQATDWIGLKGHTTIGTTAAYQSGTDTITAVVGQIAILGTGTAWDASLEGRLFYIPGDDAVYTVDFQSPTLLALDRPYEGRGGAPVNTVVAASPYVIMQDVYPLPGDFRSIVTVLSPRGLPLQPFTKDGLDRIAGSRARIGYPEAWAEYDDSPEASPPVVHQIQFSPAPLNAAGYTVEYLRAAQGFDGRCLTNTPLPFVTPTVILAGVRADIAIFQDKFQKALGYQAQFDKELARMLQVEHAQRRVKTAMQMAPRFTRHRILRVLRGYNAHGGMPNPPTNQP